MATRTARLTPQRQLWARLISLPVIKSIVIPGGMTAFFLVYFWLLGADFFSTEEMPIIWLDRWIGFSPQAIWLYVSLWLYVTLVPSLLDSRRDLLIYYLSAAAICVVGMGFFLFWPTATPSAEIDWTRYPLYQPLKAIDRSGNAFPSLHASFAVFSGVWLDQLLRIVGARAPLRVINLVWGIGILYSTLATKQHVAVDLIAGVILGFAGISLQKPIAQRLQKFAGSIPTVEGKI